MTRSQLLRTVADVIDVLDRHAESTEVIVERANPLSEPRPDTTEARLQATELDLHQRETYGRPEAAPAEARACDQVLAVRQALQAPPDEDIVAVAERRMTSIRDLVASLDTRDARIADALLGLYPGDDAPTAVQKLVVEYRRCAEENVRLKEKLDRMGA
jgi:hypothetical protein